MAYIIVGGSWEDYGYFEDYSTLAWDSGARTVIDLPGSFAATFSVGQETGIVCGLNDRDQSADYLEIDHGFYIESGKAKVVENGAFKTVFHNYSTFLSVFKIVRNNGVVSYFIDDVLIYTSLIASTGVVFLDCSLFAANDTVINATLTEINSDESLSISLPEPSISFLENSTSTIIDITLQHPVIYLEELLVTELHITLKEPTITFLMDDVIELEITLHQPELFMRVDQIVPDFSSLQIPLYKPQVRINEEENLSLTIALPKPAVTLSLVPDFCYVDLPSPVVGFQEDISNFMVAGWPNWTLEARIFINEFLLTIPSPILTATATNHTSGVSLTLPSPILTSYTGAFTALEPPAPILTATATSPGYAVVTLELPEPILVANALTGEVATVTLFLPEPVLSAYSGAFARLEMPEPVLSSTGRIFGFATVSLTIPSPELTASGEIYGLASVTLEIPSPILYAGMGNWVALEIPSPILVVVASPALTTAETTYAINLNTGAVTQLLLGGFDKLVTAHGRLYGLKNGALTRLDGNVDGTATTIPATIRFAPQTFGTNQVKRISDVYWSTREADGITMELVADERTVWRYQTPTDTAPAFGTHKIKTGRGVTFHTAGLTLRNRDGGMLDVGGVELLVSALSRKPK